MTGIDPEATAVTEVHVSRRRWPWILLALILVVTSVPAIVWTKGDIIDESACDRGGGYGDARTPNGKTSWLSIGLPTARVDGVRINSYRPIGKGLENGWVTVKLVDRNRWLNGRSGGINFDGGSYGEKLESYIPGVTKFFEDPSGARIPTLPDWRPGRRHPSLTLFIGTARSSAAPLTLDAIRITFRSGLRSQTCDFGVHLEMGPDAERL